MSQLDDLESMPEFQCGIWYSPYVKIYSIGGLNRIAEISNYPRAYKDTTPHVYIEDTPFIVTEDDLNDKVDGERIFRDSQDNIFRVGEEAIHYAGDQLPGAFPMWVESEDIPFTVDMKLRVFPTLDLPGPIVNLVEAQLKVGDDAYIPMSAEAVATMIEQLSTGQITIDCKPNDPDKWIIRIKYQRVF